MNSKEEITNAIENSIKELSNLFKERPTLFFTENDIVCKFYEILIRTNSELFNHEILDADNNNHSLIHMEYPTPFRCDMKKKNFTRKENSDNKFKRGHYDLVILNPDFIKKHSYEIIKAQNFGKFTNSVYSDKIILYGIEFMLLRNHLIPSRGIDKKRSAINILKIIKQDYAKLEASQDFMDSYKMLVFIKSGENEIIKQINNETNDLFRLKIITP
jgi:hypothetical protein